MDLRTDIARNISAWTDCECWWTLSHDPRYPNNNLPCDVCYGRADYIISKAREDRRKGERRENWEGWLDRGMGRRKRRGRVSDMPGLK